jgi:hypothetical protein
VTALPPFYYFVTAAPGRVNQDLLRIANEYLEGCRIA